MKYKPNYYTRKALFTKAYGDTLPFITYFTTGDYMAWFFEKKKEITTNEIKKLVHKSALKALENICKNPKKILLLPRILHALTAEQAG